MTWLPAPCNCGDLVQYEPSKGWLRKHQAIHAAPETGGHSWCKGDTCRGRRNDQKSGHSTIEMVTSE